MSSTTDFTGNGIKYAVFLIIYHEASDQADEIACLQRA